MLSEPEQRLSDILDAYLVRDKKYAFPKMERYDLTLMLFRTLSSSAFALTKTLCGVEERLSKLVVEGAEIKLLEELRHIQAMIELTDSITENAKSCELLVSLKKGFNELKRLGADRKALIFNKNREYLFGDIVAGIMVLND